jgi:ATP-dependent helicase/DNAse subunit B
VTSLEKYAACPYRFYLNAILRLRPRETVESITHLDPLTRGRILHDAQFHVSRRLEDEGLLPVSAGNLVSGLRLFEAVFDEVSDRFHEELAPAIERIWRDELERIRFDLRGWLRREARRDDGFVPSRREYTFGMKPQGPADPASTLEVAVLKNRLRLRGAIDLVEKHRNGRVRITDYKSGKAWMPEGAIVNGGENLQPILYALAYEALNHEEVESSRLYYCTQRERYAERVVRPDEEALSVVAEFQRRLDEEIELGFLPASPKPPLGCSYCDYLPVCGPRMQIDAERKGEDPRLSSLHWLRNLT